MKLKIVPCKLICGIVLSLSGIQIRHILIDFDWNRIRFRQSHLSLIHCSLDYNIDKGNIHRMTSKFLKVFLMYN